jgi:protein phosphatase
VDELVTIGAFARMARLTAKALRLYGELGLLPPAAVDSDTGYRYYRPSQLRRARLIGQLRELGMPLARIGEVLTLAPPDAAAVVEAHRAELATRTAERDRLARLLVDHLIGKGADMTTTLRYAGRTDIGLVRTSNEDAVHAGPEVLAVADGVRGAAGGAASAAAVGALVGWTPRGDLLEALATWVRAAEQAVRDVAAGGSSGGDAVTTLTALLLAGDSRFALVHIGDTRAYVLRRGELTQLTHDHSHVQSLVDTGALTQEAAWTHPQRALLSRALTGGGADRPDVSTHDMLPADRYLLASDGLTAVVPGARLRDVLAAESGPEAAVEALIAAAHRAGAPDNIACVVADVVEL